MRQWIAIASAAALIGFPASSLAGFAGNSLRVDYFYPNLATSLSGAVILAPGAGSYTCCFSTEFTPADSMLLFSFDDDTIVIEGQRSQVFDNTAFNGFSFFDVFFTIDPIAGVSLVSSTLPGLDASDVSSGADRVLINFAGANGFNLESWRVEVQVTFQQVPEPGTLALLGLALAGLAAARRRAK